MQTFMLTFEEYLEEKKRWVDRARKDGLDGIFRATALALPMPPSLHDALLVPQTEHVLVPHICRKRIEAHGGDVDAIGDVVRAVTNAGASAIAVSTFDTENGTGYEDVLTAAQNTHLPILCTDIVFDPLQITLARAHGAASIVLCGQLLNTRALRALRKAAQELSLQTILDVTAGKHIERGMGENQHNHSEPFRIYGADLLSMSSKDVGRFKERLVHLIPPHALALTSLTEHTIQEVNTLQGAGYHAFILEISDTNIPKIVEQLDRLAGFKKGLHIA